MKTRLNKQKREILYDLVREIVTCPDEQSASDEAYQKAASLVREAVEARYPVKDMKLLKRYEVAVEPGLIQGVNPETGAVARLRFRGHEDRPLVPDRYSATRSIPFSQQCVDAIQVAEIADGALEEALRKKHSDYESLIGEANTYEDVLEVWPEAEQVRDHVAPRSTALSILSPDAVARIREDVASRAGDA